MNFKCCYVFGRDEESTTLVLCRNSCLSMVSALLGRTGKPLLFATKQLFFKLIQSILYPIHRAISLWLGASSPKVSIKSMGIWLVREARTSIYSSHAEDLRPKSTFKMMCMRARRLFLAIQLILLVNAFFQLASRGRCIMNAQLPKYAAQPIMNQNTLTACGWSSRMHELISSMMFLRWLLLSNPSSAGMVDLSRSKSGVFYYRCGSSICCWMQSSENSGIMVESKPSLNSLFILSLSDS